MTIRRSRGFTLIELLVVIAIIAILAAMLFPVFARARESARKIQCLSNVKNIATAVQMYLVDYDRFPPSEHRTEIRDWFYANRECCCDDRITGVNPYLKWPLVFDEYVRNRDVWRCPSSIYINQWAMLSNTSPDANGDWWKAFLAHQGECPGVRGCSNTFPPGWGGTATDMITQGCDGRAEDFTGGFQMSIGTAPRWALDTKTNEMSDPTKYPVAYDAGVVVMGADRTSWIAYPDTCRMDSIACTSQGWQCGGDWDNCSWAIYCSAEKGDVRWAMDAQFRKDNAKARHLGGSNIGFADGHAAWFASEAILFGGENWSGFGNDTDLLRGMGVCIALSTECCAGN